MDDKRIFPRTQIANMTVDISDGYGFYSGFISDISQTGLCLKHISIALDDELKSFAAVVSKEGENFRMIVRPRWKNHSGYTKDIGVRIESPSAEWREFVKKFL
ncbi:MAG: PilZ domain-containing protein [Desulfocapsaceae bacterium]|nr:PilZ domain-containing protein [Desulfocapsaceae bacterium]